MAETENNLRNYESLFICPIDLGDASLEEMLARLQKVITDRGGKVGSVEKWGRRKLSFTIRRQREGFYVYWTFSSPPGAAKELNDLYEVTDGVLRHIVVRWEKEATPSKPLPVASEASGIAPAPASESATIKEG